MKKRSLKIKFYIFPLILIIISACSTAKMNSSDSQKGEVLSFFKNYIKISDNFDPSGLALYKDTAKIFANDKDPFRRMELSGAEFKKMGNEILKLAKKRGDRSEYRNIEITFNGKNAKIKADRFSTMENFLDKSYYMIVEKGPDGSYKIIEEYGETKDNLKPADIKELLKNLTPVIDNFNKSLPRMLDKTTRMDKVEIDGRNIMYYATILNADGETINKSVFEGIVKHRLRLALCESNLKEFIKAGAVLIYLYRDKNGKLISSVNIDSADCRY